MRKKTLLSLFLLMVFFIVKSQNLVPNYSFENYSSCPAWSQFGGYIDNWGGGFPFYFVPGCNDGGYGSTPLNDWGYQYPHSGNAYTGIYTYVYAGKDTTTTNYTLLHNVRDYLQDSLISSLSPGVAYYVSFYVSLGDSCSYACNSLGVYFSDSALVYSTTYPYARRVKPYLIPQIINDSTHHLTDKINWIKVSGSFVAKGGEKYIIIGNFKDDANSDTMYVNTTAVQPEVASFYYVDDVIVTTDSNYADSLFPTSLQGITRPKEEVNVFPNPANSLLNIEVSLNTGKTGSFYLYNEVGQRIECIDIANGVSTMSTLNLPSGIYFYRITDINGNLIRADKVMIVH